MKCYKCHEKFSQDELLGILPESKQKIIQLCRAHKQSIHHFFVSYRVATEEEVCMPVYDHLSTRRLKNGDEIHVFWDKRCLLVGQDWLVGFLNWLLTSKVIVLLISNKSVDKIAENAASRQDNVLVEYPKRFLLSPWMAPNFITGANSNRKLFYDIKLYMSVLF